MAEFLDPSQSVNEYMAEDNTSVVDQPITASEQKMSKLNAYAIGGEQLPISTVGEFKQQEAEATAVVSQKALESNVSEALANPTLSAEDLSIALRGMPAIVNENTNTAVGRVVSTVAPIGSTIHEATLKAAETQQATVDILEGANAQLWEDASKWQVFKDFSATIIPLDFGANVSAAVGKITGEGFSGTDVVAVGEALNGLSKWIQTVSDERIINEVIPKVLETGNVLVAMSLMDAMKQGVQRPDGIKRSTQILENTFGALDALPVVGGIVRAAKAMKIGGKVMAAGSKVMGLPLPDTISAIEGRVGNTEKVVANEKKNIQAKVAEGVDPTPDIGGLLNIRIIGDAIDDASLIGTRPALVEMLKKVEDASANVDAAALPKAQLLSPEERIAAQERLNTQMSSVEGLSTHSVRFDTGKGADRAGNSRTINVEAVYGNEKGKGYATFIEAQAGRKKLGSLASDAEIVVFDRETGQWADKFSKDMNMPEFYIKYKKAQDYDIIKDQIAETVGSTWFRGNLMKGSGWLTSYLKDNGNRFKGFLLKAAITAEDTKGTLQFRLRTVIAPLLNLKHESQARVLDIIDQGSKHVVTDLDGNTVSIGKNYSLSDLLEINPNISDKEIAAYFGVRASMEHVDSLKNVATRRKLEREGMKHYTISNGDTIAKPLATKPSITHAFNAETGAIERLTAEQIDDVYNGGGHVAKLRADVKVGGNVTEYMLVKDARRMKELPQRVINYRAGYVHRFYKEKWFVKVEEAVLKNGNPSTHVHTIAAYGSRADAQAHKLPTRLQELVDSGKATVDAKLDRNLGITSDGELALTASEGRLFTARRGESLKGNDNHDLARTEDILTSLEKDISSSAHLYTHGDVADSLMARMRSTYTDEFDPITGLLKADASKESQEAMKFVELFNGVPTMSDRIGRATLIKLSNFLEDKGFKGLSEKVADRAGANPAQALRSTAFALFIAGNPIKQLVLQSMQFTMLAAIHPRLAVKSATQALAMEMSYAARNTKHARVVERAAAKVAGVDVSEFKAMNKALADTGLLQSINNHAMLQNLAAFSAGQGHKQGFDRAIQVLGNTVKAPFKLGQKIGFTAGEAHNLTTSWLLVHNMWKEANKGKAWVGNTDLSAEWGAKSRQWTLNANKIGSFKVQQGMLSTTTQFWAFQVKAWSAILSSEAFTRGQRARMAAGIATMYGAAGFGVVGASAWDSIEEYTGERIPPVVRQVISFGLFDKFINDLLTVAGGVDAKGRRSEVAVSSSVASTAGIGLVTGFVSNEGTILKIVSGVSGYAFSSIGNALSLGQNLWKEPDMSTFDKTLESIKIAANVIPFVSNTTRGIMAIEHLKHVSKSTLSVGEQITAGEAVMLALPGFSSRKVLETYEINTSFNKKKKDGFTMGKEKARVLNSLLENEIVATGGDLSSESWLRIQRSMNALTLNLDPEMTREVAKGFKAYFNALAPSRDNLAKYLQKVVMVADDKEAALANVRRSVRLTEEEKTQANNLLEIMYENVELNKKIVEKELSNGG